MITLENENEIFTRAKIEALRDQIEVVQKQAALEGSVSWAQVFMKTREVLQLVADQMEGDGNDRPTSN